MVTYVKFVFHEVPIQTYGTTSEWPSMTTILDSENFTLGCAYEGKPTPEVVLEGGDDVIEGSTTDTYDTQKCITIRTMLVEWATESLTNRRSMNGKNITCSGQSNVPGYSGFSSTATLNVTCKTITVSKFVSISSAQNIILKRFS